MLLQAWRRIQRGFGYLVTILWALPDHEARRAFRIAWQLERRLPERMNRHSLPAAIAQIEAEAADHLPLDAPTLTAIADAAAGLGVRSSLGICLRRSIVRYRLLRAAGVPVTIHFGARKKAGTDGPAAAGIAGHAWLTLDGCPYAEDGEYWRQFVVMFSYPGSRE